jgi:hypothetical protein
MRLTAVLLAIFTLGCTSGTTGGRKPPPGDPGGSGGGVGAATGGGGSAGGAGGAVGTGGAGGTAGGGGSGGTGRGDSGSGGSGGGAQPLDASASEASRPVDAPAPSDGRADASGSMDARADVPPVNPPPSGQGPTAAGTIAYSQDFESGNMDGLGRSPPSITADRTVVVDDPLGQRGKVLRIQWRVGDDFRSAPQFRPKTFVSNNSAFNYNLGDRISYAWGYMTESTYIGATLAQNITGGDPIWMIQGRDNGIMDVVPGLVRLSVRLEAMKWYDFRVDVDYLGANSLIEMYINGQKVFTHRGSLPTGPRAHWDGGIYLTGFGQMGAGNNTPRTVYFSNLSCGRR